MRFRGVAIACLSLAAYSATPTLGQDDEPSEQLLIRTNTAATWVEADGTSVVALEGPVTIELEHATLTARQAVVWLRPEPGSDLRRAEIALVGDAKATQRDATRSGERLFVTSLVTGRIRFSAEARVEDDRSDTELFETATALRRAGVAATEDEAAPADAAPRPAPATREAAPILPGPASDDEPAPAPPALAPPPPAQPAPPPTPRPPAERSAAPTTAPVAAPPPAPVPPSAPVIFRGQFETQRMDDGTLALVFSDDVVLVRRGPGRSNPQIEEIIELQAERAVVFTTIMDPGKDLAALKGADDISTAITAAYLEGDVRVVYSGDPAMGEQRLRARRVYYEFGTDRAVMTNAVLHTVQPQVNVPVVVRAKVLRQLSQGEFRAEGVRLSTSRFATPSYSINAQRIYMRQEDTGDPRVGRRTAFRAVSPTFRFFNVPVFYLPYASGSMTDRGSVLRGIGFENSTAFGTGVETQWGLFETLGMPRPNELDASYRLDYYGDRGPAGGLDFEYGGRGLASETLREPFNFEGEFTAYGVNDEGFDDFGRGRVGEDNGNADGDADFRGHVLFEHQHFFPEDYQLQFRAGYVSDATFLEQWFGRAGGPPHYRGLFQEGPPHDVALYVKRQRDTEAYTFLTNIQPSDVVTTSDLVQEQFEVERLPEIGYRRIGDSFGDDRFTFFSRNTVGGYRFNTTEATLAEQGYGPGRPPGIPSLGFTGVEDDTTYRGDFRQEVAHPINAGPFKLVPYVVGRLTSYSDAPDRGSVHRVLGAVGARVSTAFWRAYDRVESRLFDVHRVRHVVEPELNVFTAAQNHDRNDVFVYEEDVDATHDVSALQVALRQRWQTKRGGPGRWRSVDFFTLNLEANLFANRPDEEELAPRGFRGLYFASLPETSVPRNSINADATWRISDNTVVLADAYHNLEESKLAAGGIGLLVRRDERLTYFIGNRYIDELNSKILTVALSYELTPKYTLVASQSYDFGASENVNSSFGVLRQFDAFFVSVSASHDSITNQSTFNFNLYPKGLGYGINAEQIGGVFRNNERQ